MAFEAIFHKSTTLQDVDPSSPGAASDSPEEEHFTPVMSPSPSLPASPGPNKKVQLVGLFSCTGGFISVDYSQLLFKINPCKIQFLCVNFITNHKKMMNSSHKCKTKVRK